MSFKTKVTFYLIWAFDFLQSSHCNFLEKEALIFFPNRVLIVIITLTRELQNDDKTFYFLTMSDINKGLSKAFNSMCGLPRPNFRRPRSRSQSVSVANEEFYVVMWTNNSKRSSLNLENDKGDIKHIEPELEKKAMWKPRAQPCLHVERARWYLVLKWVTLGVFFCEGYTWC